MPTTTTTTYPGAMAATGTLYLCRPAPTARQAADGTFQLLLTAVDRIGPQRVEGWVLVWAGPEASAFWQRHRAALTPGQPLRVAANHLRSLTSGRYGAPEIHAHLVDIALLPRHDGASQPAHAHANA